MVSAPARREAVSCAVGMGLSRRKACALLQISRSVCAYELLMPGKDAPIIAAMKRISATKTRYGYRRVLPLLAAEGMQMCGEKALRLWRTAGLLVPRKRTRKRPARSIDKLPTPTGCNQVWAYDFVHDTCANGQKLKCLTVLFY